MPGPRKPVDLSEIPEMHGPTVKLQVRVDGATADLIQEHYERLTELAGGTVVTLSDTLRSLLLKGAQTYRAADSNNRSKQDT